jgi:hypothetical protein
VPITPAPIPGVDEREQLSLSNPMDINRGLATHRMAVSILEEYRRRGASGASFAEWYSIDPPFPDGIFGEEKIVAGAYCNGGIMPLVGGELARAALEHGYEAYGVEQLRKYAALTASDETYLWYFPDGRHSTVETSTSPEATPTDGWGSSAMLYALAEGLAGVVDGDVMFRRVHLSPRWSAAGRDLAEVALSYAASGASFEYTYGHDSRGKKIALHVCGEADVRLHLLLPAGARPRDVRWNNRPLRFTTSRVEASRYLDAEFRVRRNGTLVLDYT